MKRFLCTALVVLAAPGVAAAQDGTHVDAPRGGTVQVRTGSGSVRVVGWDRGEVSVRGGEARVSSRDGATRIRLVDGSDDIEVRVPAGSRVDVSTMSGSIQVSGVSGTVDLKSMSGSFRISGNPRAVAVEGISGDIRIDGTTETLRAKTVSGGISVPAARGFVELGTVSGDIQVVSQGLRRGTIRNVSGRTRFSGGVPRDGSLHFENTSGETELRVPGGMAADFELTSLATGEIRSELGPRSGRPRDEEGMQVLKFSTGSRGAQITARTVSGTIRLREQ